METQYCWLRLELEILVAKNRNQRTKILAVKQYCDQMVAKFRDAINFKLTRQIDKLQNIFFFIKKEQKLQSCTIREGFNMFYTIVTKAAIKIRIYYLTEFIQFITFQINISTSMFHLTKSIQNRIKMLFLILKFN